MSRNSYFLTLVISCGFVLGLAASSQSSAGQAPVELSNAWARATVEGQPTGSAFMTIVARDNVSIIGVESPVADTVQLHEMTMQGSTMKMRELPKLDLKKGESVTLDPGDKHVMLFGLRRQLKAGDHFPVTLVMQYGGATVRAITEVEVRPLSGK